MNFENLRVLKKLRILKKKSVKLRKLEKNAEQQEQDFKDVEARAPSSLSSRLKNRRGARPMAHDKLLCQFQTFFF